MRDIPGSIETPNALDRAEGCLAEVHRTRGISAKESRYHARRAGRHSFRLRSGLIRHTNTIVKDEIIVTETSFHRHVPSAPLSEIVDCLWAMNTFSSPAGPEHLLPTGAMDLVVTVAEDGSVGSAVVGPRASALAIDTSPVRSVIGVRFRPGGGFPIFRGSTVELSENVVDLQTLWGSVGREVEERVAGEPPSRASLTLFEHLLVRHIDQSTLGHPAVRHALRVFESTKGAARIEDIARDTGVSSRRLRDVFHAEVGLTPKAFCRIRRFTEALRRLETQANPDWCDVALSSGYYDQAHFIHDFRSFSGVSPSVYLRTRTATRHVPLERSTASVGA